MSGEEKIIDAEVQKKDSEKKLTRKEKKEKKKREKQEKKKKHSPKFWTVMMILFVAALALAVFLPDYLAERNTAPETAAVSASPEETRIPSSSPEASSTPSASTKVQETAPSVPSASTSPEETASSGRIYTVRKNETLQMIAENELGDINLWKEILKENPDLGEMDGSTILKEGQKLHLPEN